MICFWSLFSQVSSSSSIYFTHRFGELGSIRVISVNSSSRWLLFRQKFTRTPGRRDSDYVPHSACCLRVECHSGGTESRGPGRSPPRPAPAPQGRRFPECLARRAAAERGGLDALFQATNRDLFGSCVWSPCASSWPAQLPPFSSGI